MSEHEQDVAPRDDERDQAAELLASLYKTGCRITELRAERSRSLLARGWR